MRGAVVVRVPFDARAMLAYLAVHLVPGVERLELDGVVDEVVGADAGTPSSGRVERLVRAADGSVVRLVVRLAPDEVVAEAHPASGVGPGLTSDEVENLLARWFGLDDDVAAAGEHLRHDDVLAPLVTARPHLRVPGHVDGFEVAAQTVLGQQVSLAAARTFTGRLAEALGTPGPDGLTLFPPADVVAAADADELRGVLRVPATRARTLVAVARACADGVDLSPGADAPAVRERLLALPGVGPWTVDYLALRALGARDAFPAGDLVLRQAFALAPAAELGRRAARWSPWRAFAAQHVWSAAQLARLTRAAATSPARGRPSRTARPRA
ncbi:AlkA N-terminal domain-containing protein [Cellulomonas sp. PSBB021]|uniref:DNA-3-methyladenine glycosylase 2 n=1 Tax=Cellulomonas sp. PSBB021 TaxID=2003551 RepID=UPI000B8D6EB5|nr:AlkA N-terminal domain-containing protein [Cellulomonas sp. PSBB021]ASR55094.1 hypothetical protein CBP52_08340 [Cellulomonas sp. PSBB021]